MIIGPLSTDMYLPGLPEIVGYFGTTDAILNISLYGFLFAQAIAILLIGPLSDKYGRKWILIGSIVTYCISSILCGFASNIWLFIILRLIQGAAVGSLIVISTALIKDCFDGGSRGRILSLVTVLSVLGPMIAPILGSAIIQSISWQATLIFPGLIVLIPLIIALFMNESLPAKEKISGSIISILGHLPKLCKNKNFTYFLLSIGIWSFPFFSFLSVSSYIFEETFGLSQTIYSLILAIDIIVATLLMIGIMKLVNKRKILIGWVLVIIGLISGVMMLTVGSLGAIICLISFIPTAVVAVSGRPYCLDILLRQYDGDTGSVSSLFNFVTIFMGCVGMIVVTLPWTNYIFGLAFCILLAGVISLTFWLLLRKGKYNLKGLE